MKHGRKGVRKKFFWAITVVSTLLVWSVAVFYRFFGYSLIEAVYKGEVPGVLNKVMRERPHPLEYYLGLGDWLETGAPVMIVIIWFLAVLTMMPKKLSAFFKKLHACRKILLLSVLFFFGVALLIPFSIGPLVLVRLYAIWLGAMGILFLGMRDFSIGRLGKTAAAVTILEFFIFCVFFLIKDPLFLDNFFMEYTFGENLEFFFYFFTGILFLILYFKGKRLGLVFSKKKLFLLFFALFFLFVAGEEISWGQRIFGLETPAFLDNTQHETNIHNLRMFDSDFILTTLVIVLAVLIPLANRWIPAFKSWIQRLGFPVLPPLAIFSVVLGLLIHTRGLHTYYHNTDEIRELFISFGFLIFAIHFYFQRLPKKSKV